MGTPATLPGDFFDKKQEAPETLPGDFFDKQTHPELPPFPIDAWVSHQVKDLSPEEQTDKRGKFASIMYEMARPYMSGAKSAAAGLNRGMAGFVVELDSLAGFLEHVGGRKEGDPEGVRPTLEGIAKEYEANAKLWDSMVEKEGVGALGKILNFGGSAAGQMVPGTAQFMLDWGSGLTIPYMAGVQQARDRDDGSSPTIAGLTKAAEVGMLGAVFKMTGPLKTWLKAGILGTYFGAEEAIASKPGERGEGFLKGAATGGLLALMTPGGKYGIRDIYPDIGGVPKAEAAPQQIPLEPMPEGLRPAIQTAEGVKEGNPGETHPEVIERTGAEEAKQPEAYKYEPLDVSQPVSGKTMYHGSKASIKDISEADPGTYGRVGAKYGIGLYLTDNPEVAGGYSRTRGKGPEGKVHAATINDAKLIDLEKPMPPDVRKIFDKIQVAYRREPGESRLAPGMTGKQVFEALKEDMEDENLPESDALEIYQNLAVSLKDAGYDGFRHEGGKTRQGKQFGPHNVAILFPDFGAGRPLTDVVKPQETPKQEAIVKASDNRGFVNQEGEFMDRENSKQWVKDNEPEVYDEWKDIAGEDAELHSQDYNLARDTVEASRRPLPLGSASALPIDNPPTFNPRTEPTGVWGAIGRVFHRMYNATTIDIVPELSDAGVSNNAVQHAHARAAVPKMVDDLLSRVFPEEYKNPKKMSPFIDLLNKDNILGGYDAFLLNASEARKSEDVAAEIKWKTLAEKVKEAHDLDAYDAEVQKAKGNKKFLETVQRWQDNVSPRLDQLYNEMKQVDTYTQRDSRGRYLDSRINLLSEDHAARWTESLLDESKPMPGPSASSYRNPNVKRDPTDVMASFTGQYSTDARAVLSAVVGHRWNEVTKMRFYNDLVDSGTAIKAEAGQEIPDGYSRMPFRVPQTDSKGHTSMVEQSLFVPKRMVGEIRGVLGTDARLQQNIVGKILTNIQLAQIADLATHTKNILSVVTRAQGAGNIWTDAVRKVPVVGSLDAIWRLAKTTREVLQDTPEMRAEIAQMAQRGLVRPEFPLTGLQKITRGQQIIHEADTASRVVMNRFFDNLVERKLALDTEENRRGFINQVGEYNSRLEGPIMRAAKESGLSPFIVAGRNFNRQGRWALTGNPGVEARSMNAAVQMRVMNLLGTASLFTLPMLLNYLTTGKMQGRAGTPIGAWDLGTEPDEDGKHKAIDLLSWTGARRGMRSIGLDAFAKGLQNGDHMNDIVGNALQDAGNTVIHPWNGPAMAFVEKTATGKQFDLRGIMEAEKVPEGGGLQFLENFRAALESQNPLVYSTVRPAFQEIGLDQKVKPSYGEDVLKTLLKSPGQAIGVTSITPPPSELERLKHDFDVEKQRSKKDREYEMEVDLKKERKRYTILKRRAAKE